MHNMLPSTHLAEFVCPNVVLPRMGEQIKSKSFEMCHCIVGEKHARDANAMVVLSATGEFRAICGYVDAIRLQRNIGVTSLNIN